MILASVGSGILMGLLGALMVWAGGHAAMTVLLAYAVIGSLGTLIFAAMTSQRNPDAAPLMRKRKQ